MGIETTVGSGSERRPTDKPTRDQSVSDALKAISLRWVIWMLLIGLSSIVWYVGQSLMRRLDTVEIWKSTTNESLIEMRNDVKWIKQDLERRK